MTEYRRAAVEGGTYFFTVNCAERHNNTLLTDNIELLKAVIRKVKNAHPFEIDAMVVLPEHLHCIWTLPVGDSNVGVRWSLIKSGFSRAIPRGERRSKSRKVELIEGKEVCGNAVFGNMLYEMRRSLLTMLTIFTGTQ